MPHKANGPCRHKFSKARYRIENWPAYDAALRDRADLTMWVTPAALEKIPIFPDSLLARTICAPTPCGIKCSSFGCSDIGASPELSRLQPGR